MSRSITTKVSHCSLFIAYLFAFMSLVGAIVFVSAAKLGAIGFPAVAIGTSTEKLTSYRVEPALTKPPLSEAGAFLAGPQPPLNLTVNTLGDASDSVLDGNCDTDSAMAGSQCTLRAAIQETNNNSGDDTIVFSLPSNSTITLHTALDAINGNLTINGPEVNLLTVQRSTAAGTPNFRIFRINSGKSVTITNLTMSNGNVITFGENGGGVLNDGSLTLTNCNLFGKRAHQSG